MNSSTINTSEDIYLSIIRIGSILRTLRSSLRELGLDDAVSDVAKSIPGARERLEYVVLMAGRAAGSVLNFVEDGMEEQDLIKNQAIELSARWDAWDTNPADEHNLALDTRSWISGVPEKVQLTKAKLHDIMMAQDIHDVTGRMIDRMVSVLNELEKQLIQMLRDCLMTNNNASAQDSVNLQAHPVPDMSSSQDDIDDLLDSLGF